MHTIIRMLDISSINIQFINFNNVHKQFIDEDYTILLYHHNYM